MSWLTTIWHRLIHRRPEPPPTAPRQRDPDLDAARREQHELINKMSSDVLRESMRARDRFNERVRESWRPDGA